MKKYYFILFLFFNSIVYGQNNDIQMFVDTNVIEFADQTFLRIQLKTNSTADIIFPSFKDTISDGMEIVTDLPLDTLSFNPFVLEKSYLITSFKDSIRNIRQLPVIVDNDTLWTNNIQILVYPLQIDSVFLSSLDTTQAIPIFDLKEPMSVPFTFREFWLRYGRWIILALMIAVFIILDVWLLVRYLRKRPVKILEKPPIPAHIIAFEKLEALKERKIFKPENAKEYYSELTGILRVYIEQRFRVPAMENTTSEIIGNFKGANLIEDEHINSLKLLLTTADMSKFAKYKPLQNYNEANFEAAYDFVDNTKMEIKPANNDTNKEELNDKL